MRDRAVCVCFDGDDVLVMRRQQDGREYSVLPGGGVEPGEQPSAAAVRELQEETGMRGRVVRPLISIDHDDRIAHYFLVDVTPAEMTVAGPEADAQSPANRYTPTWIPLAALDTEPLAPETVRAVIRDAHRRQRAR